MLKGMSNLWRFSIVTAGTLADCERLLELSLAINFNVGDPVASCFVEGDLAAANQAKEQIEAMGFSTSAPEEVPQENWVSKCAKMWEPVAAKDLTIIPVISAEDFSPTPSPKAIFISPGSGFGTGHHPSTYAALCLMQDSRVLKLTPKSVLDVGCGSGILSIAAAKLFGAQVSAYDLDQSAIDNASSCIELNPETTSQIRLFCDELSDSAPSAELILANIYGEILIALEPQFSRHLIREGFLILAGVTAEIAPEVERTFIARGYELLEHRTTDEWNAFLFRKI